MKNRLKTIILFIIALIILSILIYLKFANTKPSTETKTNTAANTITTIASPSNQPENQGTGGEGAPYERSQLDAFELDIYGLTPENTQKIPDVEDFKVALKEYIYKHGLVNSDAAKLLSTAEKDNIVQYVFQLTEKEIREREVVIAHVNTVTGKYSFGYQK